MISITHVLDGHPCPTGGQYVLHFERLERLWEMSGLSDGLGEGIS
jgi:hypothetical protein